MLNHISNILLPIVFSFTSLALGKTFYSANEASMMKMSKLLDLE